MKFFGIDVADYPWHLEPFKTNPVDGMPMVLVLGGAFTMGSSPAEGDANAVIELAPFYMACTLVDNARYKQFLKACPERDHQCTRFWAHRNFDEADTHLPATSVNHFDAAAYAQWAGGRLPGEAEWERAARGPMDHVPWVGGGREHTPTKLEVTEEVCVSGFGVLQMSGNKLEWCADWYVEDSDGRSPDTGDRRVVRGGQQPCDPKRRLADLPTELSDQIGFRYVIDI